MDKIGKVIGKSRNGSQYGLHIKDIPILFYEDSNANFQINDFVFGNYEPEHNNRRPVFKDARLFIPDKEENWITAFSIRDENNVFDPLLSDLVNTYSSILQQILQNGNENINILFLNWITQDNKVQNYLSLGIVALNSLLNANQNGINKGQRRELFLSTVISYIIDAWELPGFVDVRRQFSPSSNIDTIISDAREELGHINDILSKFYALRINATTNEIDARNILVQTPAIYFIRRDDIYSSYLSSNSQNIINSIFNYNTQTERSIENFIQNNQIEQLGQYVLDNPLEWNDYSQDDAMTFLHNKSLSQLRDFIKTTHSVVSEEWRNLYSSLLLSTSEPLTDDIFPLLNEILSDNTIIRPNIQYDNVKIIGNYLCSEAVDSNSTLGMIIKGILKEQSYSFSWEELLNYSKKNLLNEQKIHFAALRLNDADLFTLYSEAERQNIQQLVPVVKDILIERENSWSDWTSGNALFEKGVFHSRPIRLLFSQQQPEREIASEQSQLQDLFNLLPEILDYLNNTSDNIRKALSYWTSIKYYVVFSNPSNLPASKEETGDFRKKYSQEDDETIILKLLNDLSANREITLKCLKQILFEVNNEETATAIASFINEKRLHSQNVIDRFINDHHFIFEDLTVARNLQFDVFIHDSAIKKLYCDGDIESSVRNKITANIINYWNDLKRKVLCELDVHPAKDKEMGEFIDKYSQLNSNRIPFLIEDLATNFESTLCCLRRIIQFANNADLAKLIESYFNGERFISQRDAYPFIKEVQHYSDNIYLARKLNIDDLLPQKIRNLYDLESLRKENNDRYIQKHFKDSIKVGDNELIEEQKRAVLTDEDNTLVINSAGGGKTTLIEAKARYLVEEKKCDPNRILVMSFNRSISEELKNKLEDLRINNCDTFHAIAQSIITRKNGYKPTYFEEKDAESVFQNLLNNTEYKRIVLDYVLSISYQGLSAPYNYEDEIQYNLAIYEHNKNIRNRKTYLDKLFANYRDTNNHIVSCKSIEECRICDFLGSHGIPFQYEREYKDRNGERVNGPGKRPYRPDFTLFNSNGEVVLYLEHMGINKEGKCAPWINLEQYMATKKWAKDIHDYNHDIYITTTSADFQEGNIFIKLSNELSKYFDLNSIINPRYLFLQYEKVGEMCVSFVSLLKSSGQSFEDIINKHPSSEEDYFLKMMILPFMNECEHIKENDNKIDFNDAIRNATELCTKETNKRQFDYILVDEFQDISIARYHFIEALRNENTKLFCVGDDWQSIYRFTGSDISLFTELRNLIKENEGYAEINAGTTFRFGEPAISISSSFIRKNRAQKEKNVESFVKGSQTEIKICEYDNNAASLIKQILDSIIDENEESEEPSVIFLARNNPSKEEMQIRAFPYLNHEEELYINLENDRSFINYKEKKIPFYSIHAAKGLQADYVIVLNCNKGNYGIPSLVEEAHLLQYVLHKKDIYPFAEERRLFYVALTRAKKKTWLLCDKNSPSPFIEEIEEIKSNL